MIKTSELIGPALDWAVAKCEDYLNDYPSTKDWKNSSTFSPSTDWSQGGPIIDRMKIGVIYNGYFWFIPNTTINGPTLLTAAMRYYVAIQMGDEVDIPKEIL